MGSKASRSKVVQKTVSCETRQVSPRRKTIPPSVKTDPRFRRTTVRVAVVLDRSGSMSSCLDATISGFNEYLLGLKAESLVPKGPLYEVSLTQFNEHPEEVYLNRAVFKAPQLTRQTFVPAGITALYDAVGRTIGKLEATDDGTPTVVVVITDGMENASKEYTQEAVRDLIRRSEQKGHWTFVFIGAGKDAWSQGIGLGVQAMNTMSYTPTIAGTRQVYDTLRVSTQNFARMAADGMTSTASFLSPQGDQVTLTPGKPS